MPYSTKEAQDRVNKKLPLGCPLGYVRRGDGSIGVVGSAVYGVQTVKEVVVDSKGRERGLRYFSRSIPPVPVAEELESDGHSVVIEKILMPEKPKGSLRIQVEKVVGKVRGKGF